MNSLRVGVIGVGALGRHHARILAGLDGVDLVAVAETNPELGRAAAEQHHTRWVSDYRELFDEVDAVSIVVPTTLHATAASEFLMRGIPVLVEKPITNDVASAERLVSLAESSNTLLQVGHIERFNPAMISARPLCHDPKYIRAERVSPFAFRSMDIGVVHDLMIHDIDLVLDLVCAPLVRCEAFGVAVMGEFEDMVQAHLVFANGCIADLTASRLCPSAKRTMQVWSSAGNVDIDFHAKTVECYSPTPKLLFGTPPVQRAQAVGADIQQLKDEVFTSFIERKSVGVVDADALSAELSSFVEAVRLGVEPLVGGQEALAAMQVADAVLTSVAAHQWDGTPSGAIGPRAHFSAEQRRAG
ncbi:MAG: Gfo/Idh/MocA family oxidoreductase [Planctomycetota bacterium]|nr:Gfo/Idh/MocA family oxidoreductase [Planctomycetota bacterium]